MVKRTPLFTRRVIATRFIAYGNRLTGALPSTWCDGAAAALRDADNDGDGFQCALVVVADDDAPPPSPPANQFWCTSLVCGGVAALDDDAG